MLFYKMLTIMTSLHLATDLTEQVIDLNALE